MVRLHFTPAGKPFVTVSPNPPHRNARRVITPYGPGAVVGTWIAPNGEVLVRVALEYEPSQHGTGTRRKLLPKERVIMAFPSANIADEQRDDTEDMFSASLERLARARASFGQRHVEHLESVSK